MGGSDADLPGGRPAAGIQPGDAITAIDGSWPRSRTSSCPPCHPTGPGDTITATFLRGTAEQDAKVLLADRPSASG